ncbi:hypothetical protein N7489_004254 [Penicillium chrysogenum]|uniref:Pc16g04220 protein n=2 Tax=Penicillium chrysogenum species complex TaxID=254878 RepID=B6H8F4_PENRW|nr:uncharacterized protein N7525_011034 [Penicillium rubens]XP_056568427.1 uncharacterized protein N7489_004254 [Penicillium chrysogenum]CAP93092.1 Pc16g04220 [Penicillium rubens Wisconsin 54-1255]KAJ5036688.1 putative phosphoglycerate mutase pmu1 [Penicillium rubens]KAJ5244158.1 hypothetical protein N7489_004254 [Penicillium chrysogenum]KAJ5275214.1 hypothetical protein N7505_003759 [Penicillium chrysogenum]KAJ5285712.1 hypothetical protein N7524_001018 [Penicillium chrysogenum]
MRLSTLGSALVGLAVAQASTINYTTVTGYFLQDEESTDPTTFDYTAENFGLIGRAYPADKEHKKHGSLTQWERFYHQVTKLNEHSPKHVEYKVLFLGRHGEGWHNAAESYYGTPAWNCYWSELNGNSTASWADSDLTPGGISQALKANEFWQKEINEQRIHTPDHYYVSPMTRALKTANLTFTGLDMPKHSAAFKPTVKELFREGISVHTCDHRRSRSYIHDLFPHWPIEHGFTEEDELWNGVTAEPSGAQDVRSAQALGDVFFTSSKKKSFVSITSHSGEISSILRVIGHRTFKLSTGAVIPVLVKAEKVDEEPATSSVSWEVSPHCTEPPVTSVTACVCPSSAVPVTTPLATGF